MAGGGRTHLTAHAPGAVHWLCTGIGQAQALRGEHIPHRPLVQAMPAPSPRETDLPSSVSLSQTAAHTRFHFIAVGDTSHMRLRVDCGPAEGGEQRGFMSGWQNCTRWLEKRTGGNCCRVQIGWRAHCQQQLAGPGGPPRIVYDTMGQSGWMVHPWCIYADMACRGMCHDGPCRDDVLGGPSDSCMSARNATCPSMKK